MEPLKDETIFKLVDHSIGAITLDCGYQIANQSSLDLLTDVCCDYLRKISTQFRTACDTEDWRDNNSDFVDSLERIFHQTNVSSSANLHQFICKIQAIKRHQEKQQQQPQQGQQPQIPVPNCKNPTSDPLTPNKISD